MSKVKNFKKLCYRSVCFSLFTLSTFAHAEKKLCPSVELIKSKWCRMDTVTQAGVDKNGVGVFNVHTDMDYIHDDKNKSWWEMMTVVTASDFEKAHSIGQSNVKNIIRSETKYANEDKFSYRCIYDINEKNAVVAVSSKQGSKYAELINNLKKRKVKLNFLTCE